MREYFSEKRGVILSLIRACPEVPQDHAGVEIRGDRISRILRSNSCLPCSTTEWLT